MLRLLLPMMIPRSLNPMHSPNIGGTSESRVLITLSTLKAPPPLGGPWTCVTATRPNCFDRRVLCEVIRPPPRDLPQVVSLCFGDG
jgi:hypothetical protein